MYKLIDLIRRLEDNRENKLFNTIRIIKNTFFAVILTLLVAVLVVTMFSRISGKAPSFLGFSIYRISSGSMKPTLQVGDVILSRQCDPQTLEVNDIITYEGTTGEFAGKNVTHRVVKAPYEQNGEYYLVTKGDSNPTEDSPIRLDDVLGKMERKLTFVMALYNFFITPWGLIIVILLIIAAFFNEIVIFVKNITGFKEKDKNTLDDIIERYKKEQEEQQQEEQQEESEEENQEESKEEQQEEEQNQPPSEEEITDENNEKTDITEEQ